MRKLENRNFKPISTGIIKGTAILAIIGLGGTYYIKQKNNDVKSQNDSIESTNNDYDNLNENTHSNVDEELNAKDENTYSSLDVRTYSKSEESYYMYSEFYDSMNISLEAVITMDRVINSDIEGLSETEVNDSLNLIRHILLPDNLTQKIDNIKLENNVEYTLYNYPKISDFINDENIEIKEDVIEYETIRDKVREECLNNRLSISLEEELKQYVGRVEDSYNYTQSDNTNKEFLNPSLSYIENSYKEELSNLTVIVTNLSVIEVNGREYIIAPRVIDLGNGEYKYESETLYLDEHLAKEEKPEWVAIEAAEIRAALVSTKYDENKCRAQARIINKLRELNQSNLDNSSELDENIIGEKAKTLVYNII